MSGATRWTLAFVSIVVALLYSAQSQPEEWLQRKEEDAIKSGRILQFFKSPSVHYKIPPLQYAEKNGSYEVSEQALFDKTTFRATVGRNHLGTMCLATKGDWCGKFESQTPIPSTPTPRGSKDCPQNCNSVGNCNHDTGLCECPAGWAGPDCATPFKRPCTNMYRGPNDPLDQPKSHIGPDKLDLDIQAPGWTASRCAGYCDDDLALCMCGEGKYRRIPAPPGSPPGTPPVQWGRPLTESCMPKTDRHGVPVEWGGHGVEWEKLYGPKGWCQADHSPIFSCGCVHDGLHGHVCDLWSEMYCMSQCSGHGNCFLGFCKCHEGWYGMDCSRKKAGLKLEPAEYRPWNDLVTILPPAALDPPPLPTRLRPLIYIYDMPPAYTSRMLQYKIGADSCLWRRFGGSNDSFMLSMTYSIEIYMHEALMQSPHRTFDPEEADFFYVPLYITCYFWPVLGWADTPWWYAPLSLHRPLQGTNLMLEAKRWLQKHHPWWDRRGGRDHIWQAVADEGGCWVPTEIFNTSIMLTHWGRMDMDHKSGSAYEQDNYTREIDPEWTRFQPTDYRETFAGHPCYDPNKDLVIPAFKHPQHFMSSPLLGHPPLVRDILMYFRGDIGDGRFEHYSRGIRPKLFRMAYEGKWAEKYSIFIGTGHHITGSYTEHLARSKFCLVAPGDGWSPRAEDAILHGCIPLLVMDGVHAVFESLLDWDSFSIRVRESSLQHIPDILGAITDEQVARMQRRLATVWSRFAYAATPQMQFDLQRMYTENAHDRERTQPHPDHPYLPHKEYPRNDALQTILQWLYSRIKATR